MSEYRVILALLSTLVGVVLLIISTRFAFSILPSVVSRRRTLTALTYGALFLTAGVLLWSRKDLPPRAAEEPAHVQEDVAPPVIKHESHERLDSNTVRRDEAFIDTATTESNAVAVGRKSARIELQPVGYPIEVVQPVRETPPQTPEDRLYGAIDRAFSAIEAFFYRYGSPTQSGSHSRIMPHTPYGITRIYFPYIEFEHGSVKIAAESIGPLKALAADLQQRPDLRIEIQARVDSLGPEAFNFMLTQARASAVRDLLVVEGVPAERLVARGYGTQPLSTGGSNPVAFVVRR